MYKIIGVDGKEYGPVNLEQMRQWAREGRINTQTRVLAEGTTDWKALAAFPELSAFFPVIPGATLPPGTPPNSMFPPASGEPLKGLAITSFVLGLLSLVCFGLLTGIPAIICGHMARGRVRREPQKYAGEGFAMAGLIMGYVAVFFTLVVLPALLLPALGQAKGRAQSIHCVNNMKQIGLAFKVWALDHNDAFPFNVSTNGGGTMELVSAEAEQGDRNAFLHFQVLSNELSDPKILVCPSDTKQPSITFEFLQAANVSYRLRTGTNVNDAAPEEVLAICPIHGHVLHCDGSVEQKRGLRKR